MCRAIHRGAAPPQSPSQGKGQGQRHQEHQQQPPTAADAVSSVSIHAYPRDWRRRSADVGGLARALDNGADDLQDGSAMVWGVQGQGWMGGEPGEVETKYAELLSDMFVQTMNSVNDNSVESLPPSISDSKRTKLIWALDRWHFEPHLLEEDEVIACTILLFEALFRIEGMQEAVPVSMQQITRFIHHLRRIYRYENTYHNFEHALDVLQATQSYLKSAGVVPPPSFLFEPPARRWSLRKGFNSGSLIATLGKRELFVLYIAAIGHDVGHPGFNNHFMKNAHTPLAQLYPSGSALEQMHIQLLLCVMRAHGLSTVLLDAPADGAHLRKVLVQSVLATDMGVHDQFMETLRNVVEGRKGSLCQRQVVLCQAILKNADISNPTRPFLVSKHWASLLSHEWSAQASLESSYHLQPTVQPVSGSPLALASSQIFFIARYARPLLELTERAVPELRMYAVHCRKNLREWEGKKRGVERELEVEAQRERERERERLRGRGRRALPPSPPPPGDSDSAYASEPPSSVPSTAPSTPGMPPAIVPASLQGSASASGTTPTPTPLPYTLPVAAPPAPPGSPRIPGYHSAFPLTLPTHQPPPPVLPATLAPPSSIAYSTYSSYSSSSSSSGRSTSSASSSASSSSLGASSEKARSLGTGMGVGIANNDALALALAISIPLPPSSPSISASGVSDDADSAAAFSPVSETSGLSLPTSGLGLSRYPSNVSSASGHAGGATPTVSTIMSMMTAGAAAQRPPAHAAALRAASKVGSMRKRSQMDLHLRFAAFSGSEAANSGGAGGGGVVPVLVHERLVGAGGGRKAARNSWCASSSLGGLSDAGLAALLQGVGVGGGGDAGASADGGVGANPPPASAPPNLGGAGAGVVNGSVGGVMKPLPLRPIKLQVSP